jgi:hypothetical protein
MLRVSVLGGQQITDDWEGGVQVRSSRALALIACLAVHAGVSHVIEAARCGVGEPARPLPTGGVQLGMFERQGTLATRYPAIPARQVLIATGLETCDGPPPVDSLPLSSGPTNAWAEAHDHLVAGLDAEQARTTLETTQGPLAVIIDYELQPGAPARDRGTGLQPFALVPRLEVIALLALRPETPALRHVLIDDNGPALAGRLWRGFLIHDGN